MRLGEVSDIQFGKRITEDKDGDENGLYPVYGGGNISYYTNTFNRDDTTCKLSRFGISEKTCVMIIKDKYYLNDAGLTICSKNTNIITNNYLWNYLILIKTSIFNTSRGTAQAGLGIELFKILNIPVPPLEYQNKMDQTLNNFDGLYEGFNKMLQEIDDNIKTAFLNSLDDYGNPNSFNIDKIIELDNEI